MDLDRVQSGEYSRTTELVNTAMKNLLEDEHAAMPESGNPDLKSLELAKDAPGQSGVVASESRGLHGRMGGPS
jgi:Arc/MetJ-type ribon-helix-helix transcriptional regulator